MLAEQAPTGSPETMLAEQAPTGSPETICGHSSSLAVLAVGADSGHPEAIPTNYILGPDDLITLSVNNLDEISGKPMRIDRHGDINLPLAGRIHAAGLTADQLEAEIESRLKNQLNNPHVIVSVTEFRSQPVSILGAVNQPGVHQLEGRKTLFEMLSLAGGLRPNPVTPSKSPATSNGAASRSRTPKTTPPANTASPPFP